MAPPAHLKLPFGFDRLQLQADLHKVLQAEWKAHYNTRDYVGSWTSLALLAAGGDAGMINAQPVNGLPVAETPLMAGCDYFRQVIESFAFPKLNARLLCLAPGAYIKPHRDNCLGYEDGEFRLHIPLVTNDQVEFLLAGERIVMAEGSCWYINANEEHSVANRGSADRIHLVIDGARNAWSDQLFFALAGKDAFERPPKALPAAQQQAMLEELRRLGTPAALALLAQQNG